MANRYRIYYGDGTVWDSEIDGGEPPSSWNVQAVLEVPPGGEIPRLQTKGDYYVKMEDGNWCSVDIFGMIDYLANVHKLVLVGRTISNEEFAAILKHVKEDKSLPPKPHYVDGERQL